MARGRVRKGDDDMRILVEGRVRGKPLVSRFRGATERRGGPFRCLRALWRPRGRAGFTAPDSLNIEAIRDVFLGITR
jgi:hypothetical protein